MSTSVDTYRTIKTPSEGIFRDKGSKFIAYAFPFTEEEQLKTILNEVKALHPKARHHCWAYRLTPDRAVYRINDDGEPSGTAGRPILNVMLSLELTNVIVVVVRYFGGTLLGVPGLIHAYKSATQEALGAARVVEKTLDDIYAIDFDYLQMNEVMRVIKEYELEILSQEFDNRCQITLSIRQLQVDEVLGKLGHLPEVETTYKRTQ
ncbi:MAG TPA: YigZ family protein [Candidatus Sphingobacterium stercorigallinarum]|nr:YigZ family protein [Candidatus Sphingobacterium stercorigallinarum]